MTPNHALQRTRRERRGCNHRVPCAGSLSLGRYAFRQLLRLFPCRLRDCRSLVDGVRPDNRRAAADAAGVAETAKALFITRSRGMTLAGHDVRQNFVVIIVTRVALAIQPASRRRFKDQFVEGRLRGRAALLARESRPPGGLQEA